ncbi:2-dehydropantoate 2-reductase [compost metagenome]
MTMRIGIIGAGAIGGFCGLLLARAGHDVHFVVRGDFQTVSQQGLRLISREQGAIALHPVNVYSDIQSLQPCDWLIVACKATANEQLAPQLASALAPGGKVLLLQNGLGGEAILRRHLPYAAHLLGGVCSISAHRCAPGVIEHLGLSKIAVGYHSGPAWSNPRSITRDTVALLLEAGLEASASPSLAASRWRKLVVNIPFSGLTTLLRCGTKALIQNPATRELATTLMQEVAAGAARCGHELEPDLVAQILEAHAQGQDYQSSMSLDYLAKRPLELEAIYQAPLAAAHQQGFDMPSVRTLYEMLTFLDSRNRLDP